MARATLIFGLLQALHLVSAVPSGAVEDAIANAIRSEGGFSLPAVQLGTSDLQRRGTVKTSVGIDDQWYIPIYVGTPKQKLYVLPDSAANQFTLLNTLDSTLVKAPHHPPLYDPSKSSTAKKLDGYSFSNTYGSGYSESGVVYTETVYVGGLEIQNQAIELTTKESQPSTYDSERSGSLSFNLDPYGLSTKPGPKPNWWQTAKGSFASYLFAVNFHPTAKVGTIDLGFVNTSAYTGSLDYVGLNKGATNWYFTIGGLSTKNAFVPYSTSFTVDTGTGSSRFNYGLLEAYFKAYYTDIAYDASLNTWTFPCTQDSAFFSFYIGPNKAIKRINSKFIISYPIGGGRCATTLETCSTNPSDQCTLIGQDLIATLFWVFDWGNSRIGIAQKPV